MLLTITEPCLNPEFPQEQLKKLSCSENLRISSWSYDMEDHVKKMCGTTLWAGKQDDSTTLQSIYSMYRWSSFQRKRIEILGRIVKSMLSNCSEIFTSDTSWTIWYSMTSKQTCTCHHKMDQSLWQTPESFDLLHSSHLWTQTTLSCG